jgi:TatD-related deoxyribonuclease
MGKKVGLQANKIVKHFSPPLIYKDENHGLMPSVLASNKNIVKSIEKGTRFMMETDYIDDPRRPGAVLGPKTVPKRTKTLIQKNILTHEKAYIIHKKNPEDTYNICLDG